MFEYSVYSVYSNVSLIFECILKLQIFIITIVIICICMLSVKYQLIQLSTCMLNYHQFIIA